jgi:hypothetical protein
MPFQPSMPDEISLEESEALARFVHDLQLRMEHVAALLNERGTPTSAILAGSITRDLRSLEDQILRSVRPITPSPAHEYLSTAQ